MSAVVRMLARLGALLAFVAPPSSAGGPYVALGDSFSSGTGTRAYELSPACQRSRHAYPALVAERRPNLKLAFAACAGATTEDVLRDQMSSVDDATRLVTITIGGNDAGYAPVLGACLQSPAACARATDRAQRFIRAELPGRLDAVYAEIRRRAPAAKVIVLGYPRLFTGRSCAAAAIARAGLSRLNRAADLLRDTTGAAVRAAGEGFVFRDAIAPFQRHEICSQRPWINGLTSPITESFHPNAAGHSRGYAPLVLRAIAGS
ncbi:MAG TPA: SGNH/GDSL hydrolase family protein [Solirubrobacteraceae bacterium]|nr:SGNH/GDSL hydrolase family protein [Solirubrobacteraceae bacterium]